MAGHSKWNNIKRVKTAEDSKRNKIFTKLSKDIVNSIRVMGVSDPKFNSALRSAIDRAKSYNLPMDKIEKSIKKASGQKDSLNKYVTKIYEVQFSSGLEALVIFETDNPNRSLNEVRIAVNKLEGKILNAGSIKWKFTEYYKVVIEDVHEADLDYFYETDGIQNIEFDKDGSKVELLISKESGKNIANLYDKFPSVSVEELYISSNPIDVNEEEIETIMVVFEEVEDFDSIFFNNKYESFRN
jgi:YebC/PmpR family DNA-binding regulatory protein